MAPPPQTTPTMSLNGAFAATAENAPPYCFVVRSDVNQIALVETLLPGRVLCSYVRTRPFDGSEKHREHYKRFLKVKVYGSGMLEDGVIVITQDGGWTELYNITLAPSQEPSVLVEQWVSGAMCGYNIDVQLLYTGTAVVVKDIVAEYIPLN